MGELDRSADSRLHFRRFGVNRSSVEPADFPCFKCSQVTLMPVIPGVQHDGPWLHGSEHCRERADLGLNLDAAIYWLDAL